MAHKVTVIKEKATISECDHVKGANKLYRIVSVMVVCIMIGTALGVMISADTPTGFPTVIEPGSMVDSADNVVFNDTGTYYVLNRTTGVIDYSSADASSAIQFSFDNANVTYLRSSDYYIATNITMDAGDYLVSEDPKATILWLKNTTSIIARSAGGASLGGIDGLWIRTSKIFTFTTTGIILENIANFKISNCVFWELETCIKVTGNAYFGKIENCRFEWYHHVGLNFTGSVGTYEPNAFWVENCYFSAGRGNTNPEQAFAGVHIDAGSDGAIENCYFETTTNYTMYWLFISHHSWRIQNCKLGSGTNNASIAILPPDATHSVAYTQIVGCKVYGDWGHSIIVSNVLGPATDPLIFVSSCILYGHASLWQPASANVCLKLSNSQFTASSPISALVRITGEYSTISSCSFYTTSIAYNLIEAELGGIYSTYQGNTFRGGLDAINIKGYSSITGNDFLSIGGSAVRATDHCSITGNSIFSCGQYGIYFGGQGVCSGNKIANIGTGLINTYSGIYANYGQNTITGNTVADYQASPTMKYGIQLSAVTIGNEVHANNIWKGVSGAILDSGASNNISGNSGYETEASGTMTVTGAVNLVVVTHGLVATPVYVSVIGNNSGIGNVNVSSFTATQFTIYFENQPGTSEWKFYWYAQTW